MIDRRDVLKWAAGAGLRSSLRGGGNYRPVLAANTYIWTQQAKLRNRRFDIEEIYSGTHEAGYRNIEVSDVDLVPDRLPKTRELLRRFALRPVAAFVNAGTPERGIGGYGPIFYLESRVEQAISTVLQAAPVLRRMGIRLLHANPEPKPGRQPKSDAELAVQARAVNLLGAALLNHEIRLAIHQHDPEMADGAREWRSMLRHTDPKLVWFNLDVEWVFRGGQDPLTILKEAGPRIASLHIRSSQAKIRTEALSAGDIDYRAIAAYLEEIAFAGPVIVELAYDKTTAVTRPLIEDLRVSRQYAGEVFGSRRNRS